MEFICPNCKTKWDMSQLRDYYDDAGWEDVRDANNLLIDRVLDTDINGIYQESVCFHCENCEKDFGIIITFQKLSQEIQEIKG